MSHLCFYFKMYFYDGKSFYLVCYIYFKLNRRKHGPVKMQICWQ